MKGLYVFYFAEDDQTTIVEVSEDQLELLKEVLSQSVDIVSLDEWTTEHTVSLEEYLREFVLLGSPKKMLLSDPYADETTAAYLKLHDELDKIRPGSSEEYKG